MAAYGRDAVFRSQQVAADRTDDVHRRSRYNLAINFCDYCESAKGSFDNNVARKDRPLEIERSVVRPFIFKSLLHLAEIYFIFPKDGKSEHKSGDNCAELGDLESQPGWDQDELGKRLQKV